MKGQVRGTGNPGGALLFYCQVQGLWQSFPVNPQVLETVQSLTCVNFEQGREVFKEGAISDDTMYFIFGGEIGIYKDRPGGEQEIHRLGPGNFFGEMALINERPRLATARVISSQARMAVINRPMLLKLAGSSPEFLFYLLKHAVGRLLAAEDKLQRVREDLDDSKRKHSGFR